MGLTLLILTCLSFGLIQGETTTNAVTGTISYPPVELRLVGGSSDYEGRVEIFHDWQWGTICDDEWDVIDAAVVCRQLGFGSPLSAQGRATFGQGSGIIWLDNVRCNGTESSLDQCQSNGWGTHNCAHYEDAGVVCRQPDINPETEVYPTRVEETSTTEDRNRETEVWRTRAHETSTHYEETEVWRTKARETTIFYEDVFTVSPETVPPEDYERGRTSWLDCEGSFMTVFVNRSFVQDGVASDLHLRDTRCKGSYYDEHFIEMQSMYDLCGTTVEQGENGTMMFKNEITYIPPASSNLANVISRDFALRIPIMCKMDTGGTAAMTSFHPNMRTIIFEEKNLGSFGFELMIFHDDSFNTSYDLKTDYPVQVHVRDTVYFEARVNTRQNLQLFVDTCRATPSPNPYDTPNYVILKNGCPYDDSYRQLPSSQPTVQRFSLEAFAFVGRFTTVFVHCEMLVCKVNDIGSRCAQGCKTRRRRDLKEDKSSRLYSLNQGPLVVQRGPPNLRNRRAAPDAMNLNDGQESYSSDKMITLLGTGVLIAMCVVAGYIGLFSRVKRVIQRAGVRSLAAEHLEDQP